MLQMSNAQVLFLRKPGYGQASSALPGLLAYKSLTISCPGRSSPSNCSHVFQFYTDTTPPARTSMKTVHLSWKPIVRQFSVGLPTQPGCRMPWWRQAATFVSPNVAWYLLADRQPGQGDLCVYTGNPASPLSSTPAAQSSHKNSNTVCFN